MNTNLLHHIATAVAFLMLIIWYYLLHNIGFFAYFSDYFHDNIASEYTGAGLMVGIAIGMTPAFFVWNRFNKWVERKLNIKGKYYEDDFYKDKD